MKALYLTSAAKAEQLPQEKLPEIAFLGRSNCGKSTLLNALAGARNLARTSRTPGRTQMANFFEINDKVYFVDLPGYGFAKTPTRVTSHWESLLSTYLQRGNIRHFLFLMDCRRGFDEADKWVIDQIKESMTPIIVLTKMDKLNRNQQQAKLRECQQNMKSIGLDDTAIFGVSSTKKSGIDELKKTILS